VTRFPTPEAIPEGGVAVFADSHLGQAPGDADDFLEALGEVHARGFGTVVLLGDIFHYFIGDRKFETPLVRRVVDGWERLAAAGLSLRYVEGNRDFFLDGSPWAGSMSRYGQTDGLEVGGRRYAFVHGDRINTNDLPYRFWRVLSKNPVSWAVMKVLPGPLARTIVARTEARLYRTNFRHKKRLPERFLLLEGARARGCGYDQLLVGHFHVDRLFESESGSTHILPAWLEERRHAEIAPDGTLTIVQEKSAVRALPRGKA
jgi:UDP-2,3-diacylglucosamine hydrolase